MPFYLDGTHASALAFLTHDMPRPVHLRNQRPYRDQEAAYRAWVNYHTERMLAIPHQMLIEVERAERLAVREREREREQAGLWGQAVNPAAPAPPRQRFVNPFAGEGERAPMPEVPREYTPPNEVIITSIEKKPLFMPYDNLAEARLRLRNSVIRLNGSPIHVIEVMQGRGNALNIHYRTSEEGDLTQITYAPDAGLDLSPLPARYVLSQPNHKNANWAFRLPARGIYQQGGNKSNTQIRRSGDGMRTTIGAELNIVKAYWAPNEIRGVDEAFKKIGSARTAMPCSDHVAVFAYDGKPGIEYHGIKLADFNSADISNGGIVIKTEVPLTPLMEKRINEVGIKIAS